MFEVPPSPEAILDPPEGYQQFWPATPAHPPIVPDGAPSLFRHSGWSLHRSYVWDAFHRTSQAQGRLNAFFKCGRTAYVLRDCNDPEHFALAGSSCRDRMCLPCQRDRAVRIKLNLAPLLADKPVRFLTLTLRSVNEPLKPQLERLITCARELRRTEVWKRKVTGGVQILEVTYNAETRQWHPHAHCLLLGKFLPVVPIRKAWKRITADSHVLNIQLARSTADAIRYVTTYITKPVSNRLYDLPSALDEYIVAMHGVHTVATFGSLRGTPLEQPPNDTAWEVIGTLDEVLESARAGNPEAIYALERIDSALLRELQSTYKLKGDAPHGPEPPIDLWYQESFLDWLKPSDRF